MISREPPIERRAVARSLRLLRLGNPMVRVILGSPLHRLLSRRLVLLEYTGRAAGSSMRWPAP